MFVFLFYANDATQMPNDLKREHNPRDGGGVYCKYIYSYTKPVKFLVCAHRHLANKTDSNSGFEHQYNLPCDAHECPKTKQNFMSIHVDPLILCGELFFRDFPQTKFIWQNNDILLMNSGLFLSS